MTNPQDPYGQQYATPAAQSYPQQPYPQYPPRYALGPAPDSNMLLPILATVGSIVLCMNVPALVLGIIGIVKAGQVETLWAAGDQDGAREASMWARRLGMWGLIVLAAITVITAIIVVAYFVLSWNIATS
ncbi:MAG: CD225/dispanin family protein [Gordonia sp. (in: high G+C Gram-positive bacteria)]|uniref:CD225/dispanin family protein n=1 Tax=Gordonia sp. (in: high G+C Gram-positive bacteria) TaxID=84139 RepID=UPI0039E5FBBE